MKSVTKLIIIALFDYLPMIYMYVPLNTHNNLTFSESLPAAIIEELPPPPPDVGIVDFQYLL